MSQRNASTLYTASMKKVTEVWTFWIASGGPFKHSELNSCLAKITDMFEASVEESTRHVTKEKYTKVEMPVSAVIAVTTN